MTEAGEAGALIAECCRRASVVHPGSCPGGPTGHVSGASGRPSASVRWSTIPSGSMPGRAYLFTNAISGMLRARATWKSCSPIGEVDERGLDAAAHVLGVAQIELEEDRVDVALDRALGDHERLGDG